MNVSREGQIDLTNLKYVSASGYDTLLAGDILFNNTNSPELVGKTAYIKRDSDWAYSNHMTRVRLADGAADPAWVSYSLHYLFVSGFFKLHCSNHVNQASINSRFLADQVVIPLPPLAEQRRIVAEIEKQFSRLDAAVEALKRAQGNLRRYRASVLKAACEGRLVPQDPNDEPASELLNRALTERRKRGEATHLATLSAKTTNGSRSFSGKTYSEPLAPECRTSPSLPSGWICANLGELVELTNGINFSASQKGTKGVPTIDVLNMYGRGTRARLTGLYRVDFDCRDHQLLRDGDILFVRSSVKREGVGWTALVKGLQEPTTYCGFIIRARLQSDEISPDYLTYFFRSNAARQALVAHSSQVTITNINHAILERFILPLPPLTEQHRIIAEIERRLSVVDALEVTVGSSLKRAERLRQSILKRAFEGKLVPQDPNDEPASVLLERIRAGRDNGSRSNRRTKADGGQPRLSVER